MLARIFFLSITIAVIFEALVWYFNRHQREAVFRITTRTLIALTVAAAIVSLLLNIDKIVAFL